FWLLAGGSTWVGSPARGQSSPGPATPPAGVEIWQGNHRLGVERPGAQPPRVVPAVAALPIAVPAMPAEVSGQPLPPLRSLPPQPGVSFNPPVPLPAPAPSKPPEPRKQATSAAEAPPAPAGRKSKEEPGL